MKPQFWRLATKVIPEIWANRSPRHYLPVGEAVVPTHSVAPRPVALVGRCTAATTGTPRAPASGAPAPLAPLAPAPAVVVVLVGHGEVATSRGQK